MSSSHQRELSYTLRYIGKGRKGATLPMARIPTELWIPPLLLAETLGPYSYLNHLIRYPSERHIHNLILHLCVQAHTRASLPPLSFTFGFVTL